MTKGSQVAVAIGTGYLLGRRRKTRLAMMLAAAAAAGGAGGIAGSLARRGAKTVGSSLGSADLLGKVSPELGELGGLLRHDLLDAGKGAAKTAVNSRIDSLSDRLHEQAESWRNPAQGALGAEPGGQTGPGDEATPGEDAGEAGDEEGRDGQAPRRPARARRSPRQASAGHKSEHAERNGERAARPSRRAARTTRSEAPASPVRRTGR